MKIAGLFKRAVCAVSALCLFVAPLAACADENGSKELKGVRVTKQEWAERIMALYRVGSYTETVKGDSDYVVYSLTAKVDPENRVTQMSGKHKKGNDKVSLNSYEFRENGYYYDPVDCEYKVYDGSKEIDESELYHRDIEVREVYTYDETGKLINDGTWRAYEGGMSNVNTWMLRFYGAHSMFDLFKKLIIPDEIYEQYGYEFGSLGSTLWEIVDECGGMEKYFDYIEQEYNDFDYHYSKATYDDSDGSYIIVFNEDYTARLYFSDSYLYAYKSNYKGYEDEESVCSDFGKTTVKVPSEVKAVFEEYRSTHNPNMDR